MLTLPLPPLVTLPSLSLSQDDSVARRAEPGWRKEAAEKREDMASSGEASALTGSWCSIPRMAAQVRKR